MFNLSWDITWDSFRYAVSDDIPPDLDYIDMAVKVIPDWGKSVYLEWYPSGDEENVTYNVYSSESEAGPFIKVTAQPIPDTMYYTDFQINDSKVYEQFFTIEMILENGDKKRTYPSSPSKILSKWHSLRQKDIIRREALLLDKFVGAETIVFVKKRHGTRCSSCWDTRLKKVMQDHCEVCYGTSYEGGYHTGMITKMQYSSIDAVSRYSYQGLVEPINISAWGLPYPILYSNTLLLRLNDRKVFRINGHQGSTEMLTTLQRQNVSITELSRDSVEYRLFDREDLVEVFPRKPHIHT